jgi:phage terminase large subunit GpA-like protein
MTRRFKTVGEIFVALAEMLRPPEELSVADSASKFIYLNNVGAYIGPFKVSTVPYMREPMNTFTSHEYSGMVFVGSAQAGKTESLILAPLTYSVMVEPMDMMLVCPTMLDARDFSMRRVDRLHHYSEKVGGMLIPGGSNDNTFDKHYQNGMLFTLGWPTRSQLAGKPIPRMVLTDRDRMDDDVEGDGEPFDLASQRTTTFGRYAMTLAESSPSREIENPKWIPRTAHEAPPCKGIVGLYNRGDRRRWYWPCPSCSEYFEGDFSMLTWVTLTEAPELTNLERAETVRMQCPHCDHKIHPDEREEMQQWGVWVKDGQGVDKAGRVFGPKPRTLIASFWLKGVAAAFTSWKKLVALYLDACDDFERTGSEESLRKFYNNNLGMPYIPRNQAEARLPEVLKARAEKGLAERRVPAEVRFLIAAVDVQKNMWRVNIYGIIPGKPFDLLVIDRYDVRKSKRSDDQGDPLWVKPHAYLEDWDELIEHVMEKEYELADGSGAHMGIRFTVCDSGGKDGVTTMAYNFYRRLVEENKHRRFILYKGDPKPGNPRARITYPDSSRKDNKSGARGDIPVLLLNSNLLKDDLNGRLDCIEPGKGMVRFPDWLPDSFYSEMCSEIRTDKGWENPSNSRNEDWDLTYVTIGLCVSELLRVEHLDWNNPPGWAAVHEKNDLVRQQEQAPRFSAQVHSAYNFAEFAKSLA